jgi:hypothetical protein
MEQRFPPLKGRVDALRVLLDRATFRNPVTGADMRQHVLALLKLDLPHGGTDHDRKIRRRMAQCSHS